MRKRKEIEKKGDRELMREYVCVLDVQRISVKEREVCVGGILGTLCVNISVKVDFDYLFPHIGNIFPQYFVSNALNSGVGSLNKSFGNIEKEVRFWQKKSRIFS